MLNRIQNVQDKTLKKQFCMFMPNFNMTLSNMNTNMISMTRTRFNMWLLFIGEHLKLIFGYYFDLQIGSVTS